MVVLGIIGLLATISILGYGAWRTSVSDAQVKSDLNAVASAMENSRTFNNGYSATVPDTVKPGNNVTLTPQAGLAPNAYCVDGVSSDNPTGTYYVSSESKDQGALSGVCTTRPGQGQQAPSAPTGLTMTAVASTSISLSWSAGSGGGAVASYTAQCASDASYVSNPAQTSTATTSGTVSGLVATSTHYCRVKAVNAVGDSAWSATITTNTTTYDPPTNLAATSTTISSITLGWTGTGVATSYTVQCARDTDFLTGLQSTSISAPSTAATIGSLPFNTPYYCRVNAVNPNGTSPWTATLSTASNNKYGSLPLGTSSEGYWTTPPTGFLLEDGSAVSRTMYSDLFALIGTTYGAGDGSTTFNLPDSRGRITVNLNPADTQFDTMGEKYGEKTHTMTLAELPSHAHQQYVTANGGGSAVRNDYSADANGGIYPQGLNGGGAGGGGARNNIQPTIVKQFAIKYTEVDPAASKVPVGTSIDGYWSTAPTGYLVEDSTTPVSRSTYSELFALVGTTYGVGNGSTTFTLPDSKGRTKVNINSTDTQFATMGLKYGEKTHVMTIAEMASHSHLQYVTANSGGGAVRNDYAADANGGTYDQGIQNGGAGSGQAQNVIQPSIVKLSVIKATNAVAGTGQDVATGTSVPGYWSTAPTGYLLEDGAAVSRTTYANLYNLIGTTYGVGDGSTTFNLPDSRGRAVANLSSSDTEFDTMGEKYGEKAHVLTVGEMPGHSHTQYVTALSGGSAIRNDYKSDASGGTYTQGLNGGGAGGNAGMNVIQPSIAVRFAIRY